MSTIVHQSSDLFSHGLDRNFGLPPLAISTTVGSPLKSSEWSFPSQLYEQLGLQAFCEAKEDEFLLPNFSPLRCTGKPEVWPVDRNSFLEDDLTTEDSGSDAEDLSIAESDSDSDTDSSHSPSSVSLPSQPTRYAYDDTTIRTSAMQSVDLFSHPWTVEDASSSRREIRSHRAAYGNHARLEYMLWRVWTKRLNGLETVSSDMMMNWSIRERDEDVTWLYVPLMPAPPAPSSTSTDRAAAADSQTATKSPSSSKKSSSPSLSPKKSILKRRSVPEQVLERFRFNCSRAATWPTTGNPQRLDRNHLLHPASPKKQVRFVGGSNAHLIPWRWWLFNGCEFNEE